MSVTCSRSEVFSRYSCFPHDITEILLKVAFNKITLTPWLSHVILIPIHLFISKCGICPLTSLSDIISINVFTLDTGKYRSVLNIITSITAHHIILTAIVSVTTFITAIILSEWVSDCCLMPIFQLYHGQNKLIFNEMMMMMRSALY